MVGQTFTWDSAHGAWPLATVTGQNAFGANALFINDNGRIVSQFLVGQGGGCEPNPIYEVAFWDSHTGFRRIAPGRVGAAPIGVTSKGQILGQFAEGAFLYNDAVGVRSLRDLLPANFRDSIGSPISMSENGLITAETIHMVNGTPVVGYVLLTPSMSSLPLTIASLTSASASLNAGHSGTGTVTLTQSAPTGGVTVKLTGDNAYLALPATVTVAAGATKANFTITTRVPPDGAAIFMATLTASLNGSSATAGLQIVPVYVRQTTISPSKVKGGANATMTILLSDPAPAGGVKVRLSSDNIAATLPASITIPQGSTSATVTIKTKAVKRTVTVTLSFLHPVSSGVVYLQIL